MDNIKDDGYYINKVIENIDAIGRYIQNITYDDFVKSDLLIDAVMFRLIQMIENMNHISIKYRQEHPNIKWGLILGFRNGIVHNYGKTDYTIVFDIVTKDIIELKKSLNNDAI